MVRLAGFDGVYSVVRKDREGPRTDHASARWPREIKTLIRITQRVAENVIGRCAEVRIGQGNRKRNVRKRQRGSGADQEQQPGREGQIWFFLLAFDNPLKPPWEQWVLRCQRQL